MAHARRYPPALGDGIVLVEGVSFSIASARGDASS
jgi:hypothetical protein